MKNRQIAKLILRHIRKSSPKAEVRLLDEESIMLALRTHLAAIRKHKEISIKTRLVGGFVCNSYTYSAQSDLFELFTDANGFTTYTALRARAESRPFGKGDLLRVWTITPNGGMKRVKP